MAQRAEISNKQAISARPESVQVVIHILMTKIGIDIKRRASESDAAFESVAGMAIRLWDSVVSSALSVDRNLSEEDLADAMISELRKDKCWGEVLRGDSN